MKKQSDTSESRLTELEAQVADLKNKYLRALADYQNLEKRSGEERISAQQYAGEAVIRKFLPILDGLVRAGVHIQNSGLDLIIKEFTIALKDNGVEKIDVMGKLFDPHQMECIDVAEGPENQVIEELESGYVMHERVIRAARVKVGKNVQNNSLKEE